MPGKVEKGIVLFIGGPLNFSWQPVNELAPDFRWGAVEPANYHLERLTLGPQKGENKKPIYVPIYLLDGFEITPQIMYVIRSAILRKFGYI